MEILFVLNGVVAGTHLIMVPVLVERRATINWCSAAPPLGTKVNMNPTTPEENVNSDAIQTSFCTTFFLCLFLGIFGAHRFYTGKTKSGIVQLLTCGGVGVWSFIDIVMILVGKFKDKSGVFMANTSPKLTWASFAIVLICGIGGFGENSGTSESSSGRKSSGEVQSQSSFNRKFSGVYECTTPAWVIQLGSDGSYSMQALDSGDKWRGSWESSGNSGVLKPNSAAEMSFTIQGDGALVIDKYGYTFVKTR